jgi:hypothetical protein
MTKRRISDAVSIQRAGPVRSTIEWLPNEKAYGVHRRASRPPAKGQGRIFPVARMMGGDVTVTSEPGKGSVFTVRLPGGQEQNTP